MNVCFESENKVERLSLIFSLIALAISLWSVFQHFNIKRFLFSAGSWQFFESAL
jgi:hypothetical protein